MTGTVTDFDERVGLGTIEAAGQPYRFHCVEIADGSRSIEVGATVEFSVMPKLGRLEAADITPA